MSSGMVKIGQDSWEQERLKVRRNFQRIASTVLGPESTPTFAGLTLLSKTTSDPTLIFKTTNTANQVNIFLDESATDDHIDFAGQTASVNTRFHVIAQSGQSAYLGVQQGSYRGELILGSGGHLTLQNVVQDMDIVLKIDDGGVAKTITWDADVDKLIHSAGIFNLGSKVTAGVWGSPIDVTTTRKYGFELHYSGNNYDVTGIRSRANLITTDASTRTACGALLQAASSDGVDVGVLQGALIEAIGKSTIADATIINMRGALIGTEWEALNDISNLKTLHIRGHSRNAAGQGSFTIGYALYIENEAVGGNGQAYNAGIYFKGTNLSGGNSAYTYGIDFTGATYGTATILTSNGIIENSSGYWGIGTNSPRNSLDIDFRSSANDTSAGITIDIPGGNGEAAISLYRVGILKAKLYANGSTGQEGFQFGGTAFDIRKTVSGNLGQVLISFPTLGTNTKLAGGRNSSSGAGNDFIVAGGATNNTPFVCGDLILTGGPTTNTATPGNVQIQDSTLTNTYLFVKDSTGFFGFGGETVPETLVELTHATPYVTTHNSTHEDTDGGGESRWIGKREDGAGTESAAGQIEISHDGAGANDQLGKIVESVNTGAGLVEAFRLDSNLAAFFTKIKLTEIGGYAVKLTNKTGANTVAGQLVKADTATDDAVILAAAGDVECFGVFLDAGIADGSEAWVVVSGIADVAFDDNVAAVRGDWVSTGVLAGYAATANSPAAAPTHFEEIGHCIESVAAAGGGTHILARCILHFN